MRGNNGFKCLGRLRRANPTFQPTSIGSIKRTSFDLVFRFASLARYKPGNLPQSARPCCKCLGRLRWSNPTLQPISIGSIKRTMFASDSLAVTSVSACAPRAPTARFGSQFRLLLTSIVGGPRGTRTHNPRIKSPLLCQLS